MALVLHLLLSSRANGQLTSLDSSSIQWLHSVSADSEANWQRFCPILRKFEGEWGRATQQWENYQWGGRRERRYSKRWARECGCELWWSDHDNDVTVQMCTVTSLSWSHHQSSQGSGNCWQGREAPGYDSPPLCHAHNTHLKEILTNLKKSGFLAYTSQITDNGPTLEVSWTEKRVVSFNVLHYKTPRIF